MGFAKPHGAEKDDVGVLFYKQESKEGLHLESVDTLGPVPLELFEGFDDRKASGFDARFHGVLTALLVLAVDESGEVLNVVPGLLGRLLGQFGVMGFYIGQFELVKLLVQKSIWVHIAGL